MTRAPAFSAIARVRSVDPASTSTTSSQKRTLSMAAWILCSSFWAISTAEMGVTASSIRGETRGGPACKMRAGMMKVARRMQK